MMRVQPLRRHTSAVPLLPVEQKQKLRYTRHTDTPAPLLHRTLFLCRWQALKKARQFEVGKIKRRSAAAGGEPERARLHLQLQALAAVDLDAAAHQVLPGELLKRFETPTTTVCVHNARFHPSTRCWRSWRVYLAAKQLRLDASNCPPRRPPDHAPHRTGSSSLSAVQRPAANISGNWVDFS